MCDDESTSPHERYLRLYELVRERDKALASAFDDVRRTTAMARLATMCEYNLLTKDDLARFSSDTERTGWAPGRPRRTARRRAAERPRRPTPTRRSPGYRHRRALGTLNPVAVQGRHGEVAARAAAGEGC